MPRAQGPARQRLPVTVNARRVKTIDVHSHCLFHEATNLLRDDAAKLLAPVKGAQDAYTVIAQRLQAMNAMAIDMEVLSINPFWYGKSRDLAEQIVMIQNEKLGELWVSAVLRAAFGPRVLRFAGRLQSGYRAEKAADRIPEATAFRRVRIHARGNPPSRGAGRGEPAHARQRSPVSVGAAPGGSDLRVRQPE
ncbi:MAG: hypothetical protein ABSC95_04825 [Acetobacteraceae bacterium]|jgi:hypothetical protein